MGQAPSLGAAFLALLPVGIAMLGVGERSVWRISGLIFVLYYASVSAFIFSRLRGFEPESREHLSNRFMAVVAAGSLVNFVAQLLNSIGVWFEPQPGVYFLGLIFCLIVAAAIFVRAIFVRPQG